MTSRRISTVTLALLAMPVFGANPAGDLAAAFDAHRIAWTAAVLPAARWLFTALLVIELVIIGMELALESGWSMREFAAKLVNFILKRGFWAAVLLNAAVWLPNIIDSFTKIGVSASGVGVPFSPSDVWDMGWDLADKLGESASSAAWWTSPGTSIVLGIGMWVLVFAFAVMAASLVVTLCESFMVLSIGYIGTGFGASRFTDGMSRNYVNTAISIGIKIMALYCILGAAKAQVAIWQSQIDGIDTATDPLGVAMDVMGGSLILAICTFLVPKVLGAIASGAMSGHHGDFLAPLGAMAGMASMGASLALRSAGITSAVVGGARAASSSLGKLSGSTGGGGKGGSSSSSVRPPSAPNSPTSRPVQPPKVPASV